MRAARRVRRAQERVEARRAAAEPGEAQEREERLSIGGWPRRSRLRRGAGRRASRRPSRAAPASAPARGRRRDRLGATGAEEPSELFRHELGAPGVRALEEANARLELRRGAGAAREERPRGARARAWRPPRSAAAAPRGPAASPARSSGCAPARRRRRGPARRGARHVPRPAPASASRSPHWAPVKSSKPYAKTGVAVRRRAGSRRVGCAPPLELAVPEPEPVELGAVGRVEAAEVAVELLRSRGARPRRAPRSRPRARP